MHVLIPSRGDLAALAVVGAIVLMLAVVAPRALDVPLRQSQGATIAGTVLQVVEERVDTSTAGAATERTFQVDIEGRVVTVVETIARVEAQLVAPGVGDRVLLQALDGPDGPRYFIVDHVRTGLLLTLALGFAALVLFIGRWYGLRSLLGLAATYLILIRFILPGILSGQRPPGASQQTRARPA